MKKASKMGNPINFSDSKLSHENALKSNRAKDDFNDTAVQISIVLL